MHCLIEFSAWNHGCLFPEAVEHDNRPLPVKEVEHSVMQPIRLGPKLPDTLAKVGSGRTAETVPVRGQ